MRDMATCSANTNRALMRMTAIPQRKLPRRKEAIPTSEVIAAAPAVPDTNMGVAFRVAPEPNIFANLTMLVGKIAEHPRPAIAEPINSNVSLITISDMPTSIRAEHNVISLFSDTDLETYDATPRPRT